MRAFDFLSPATHAARLSGCAADLLCGFLMLVLISGCAPTLLGKDQTLPDQKPAARAITDQPRTGLALSGGGSKSAPFVLGVLAGLQKSGVLDKVDVMSTVSGGSYAALYYYSRLLSPDPHRDRIFWDCLPRRYAALFAEDAMAPEWSTKNPNGLCPDAGGRDGRYWPGAHFDQDLLKQASHVRGYQDVFGDKFDYRPTTDGRVRVVRRFTRLVALNSGLFLFPALVSNSLFDWRLDLSPTKEAYAAGIRRAYGRDAVDVSMMDPVPDIRPPGDPHSIARVTFDSLRMLYEEHRHTDHPVPLWIINATAGTTYLSNAGDQTVRYTGEVNGFEFTPYGYGSNAYGWADWGTRELQPDVQVAEAVGASAAFFDSQQRSLGPPFVRPVINGVIHGLNLNWGTDIPNYNLTRGDFYSQRALHSFLPWPFYLFHRRWSTQDALYIHLSDGGMSENLGVAALLRRGVKDIIVVDAASDSNYDFGDLCELDKQLRTQYIEIAGLQEDFRTKCGKGNNPFKLKDHLPAPVLRGRICSEGTEACSDSSADVRLYIIKPVLNQNDAFPSQSLADAVRAADKGQLRFKACGTGDSAYPCEVVGYLRFNGLKGPFPQHSTVRVTANSSPFIYGAYKELGRFYARQLEVTSAPGRGVFCLNERWRGQVPADQICPPRIEIDPRTLTSSSEVPEPQGDMQATDQDR